MPKIPPSLKASSIVSNVVPVKSKGLSLETPKNALNACVACRGSGKNSQGSLCTPCNGRGVPYVWKCPSCNREHHGFGNTQCRNENCPGKRPKGKR